MINADKRTGIVTQAWSEGITKKKKKELCLT